LTLLECVGRRQLALEEGKMAGLYAGNPPRDTARPTAERFLEAFGAITLTVIALPQQTLRHVTLLSAVQRRILAIVGFSAAVYRRLEAIAGEPPSKWSNRKYLTFVCANLSLYPCGFPVDTL
jgi:hypothetical protein